MSWRLAPSRQRRFRWLRGRALTAMRRRFTRQALAQLASITQYRYPSELREPAWTGRPRDPRARPVKVSGR